MPDRPTPSPGPALVTGASAGIGRAFARDLAARGHRLILVARREERLRELAAELAAAHGTESRVVVADLATDGGLAACREAIDREGEPLGVAVLNAGFGSGGLLWRLDRAREGEMVRLNCLAVVDLAAHALGPMVAAGRGEVIVISSAAAWQPVPYMATYAATKAFDLHFTEALAGELRGTGVRATAVCPGPVRTEFSLRSGARTANPLVPFDDAEVVVRAAWRALERGRARTPAGAVARLSMLASRLLPRRLVVWGAALAHRRAAS